MSERLYPTTLAEIEHWRQLRGVSSEEARQRFVQFVALSAIDRSPWRNLLAFKGGNALRFVFLNPRSTIDLDFTGAPPFPDDGTEIKMRLNAAVTSTSLRFGIKGRCQSVHRNPKSPDKTLPTYLVKFAFAFPWDRFFQQFESIARGLSRVVPIEISLNDVVCESTETEIGDEQIARIRVCTLDDIVAEKLRSLLQQRNRNRHRRQDVFDVANILKQYGRTLDRDKIARFFVRKSEARAISATRAAFDTDIQARASVDYDLLRDATGDSFIPFDTAWASVMGLVNELDIPAE